MNKDKLLPVSNMVSSGLRKMFIFIISNTGWCHSVGVSCNFMETFMETCFCCIFGNTCIALWQMLLPLVALFCGRCYSHQVGVVTCCFISGRCWNHQADVMAFNYYLCLADVCYLLFWLVLLPLFALVVIFRVADVIAKVADVVATDYNCCSWQMLLPRWLMLLPLIIIVPVGRCYCQSGWCCCHWL